MITDSKSDIPLEENSLQCGTVFRANVSSPPHCSGVAVIAASKQPLVGSEWNDRQQEFLKTLEELSMHRQKLLRKRVEVESQVVRGISGRFSSRPLRGYVLNIGRFDTDSVRNIVAGTEDLYLCSDLNTIAFPKRLK